MQGICLKFQGPSGLILYFYFSSVQNNSSFSAEAIAWVDATDGVYNAKLIIGENISVSIGEASKEIWFNFKAND